ncbi:MAG: ATP phosphoribosyltransferase [Firmicutes bacterium]|nr:ATP phosphoribosyltransferase [Bacillota bacterium]
MINIALPKGRLGKKVYELFSSLGYSCSDMLQDNRKLIFTDPLNTVRYFLVKPSDVAIYVEHGAADIGVAGKDVLLETDPDVFELMDMNFGKCRMCVCVPDGFEEDTDSVLRVATKYPNIAKRYYKGLNREIEIIKLNGSIELAPLLNLSDVIVDIVETGSTLRENHMHPQTDILSSSARLIANKSAYHFKCGEIDAIVEKLKPLVYAEENAK